MLRHQGALLGALAGCLACTGSPRSVAPPPAANASASFSDGPAPLPRYHSARLRLSLPLPDGPAWRIDDHSRAELLATHRGTDSRVVVAVFRSDDLVGRAQCESLARQSGLTTRADLRLIEDQIAVTQGSFDTRIEVGVQPRRRETDPLVGHVLAFGGFLRKCYAFDYSTFVRSDADETTLSSRLAIARTRILGGLELDASDASPYPAGHAVAGGGAE